MIFCVCAIWILTDAMLLGHWHEKWEIEYLISAISPVCDREEIDSLIASEMDLLEMGIKSGIKNM